MRTSDVLANISPTARQSGLFASAAVILFVSIGAVVVTAAASELQPATDPSSQVVPVEDGAVDFARSAPTGDAVVADVAQEIVESTVVTSNDGDVEPADERNEDVDAEQSKPSETGEAAGLRGSDSPSATVVVDPDPVEEPTADSVPAVKSKGQPVLIDDGNRDHGVPTLD